MFLQSRGDGDRRGGHSSFPVSDNASGSINERTNKGPEFMRFTAPNQKVSHRAFGAVHGRGPLVVPRVTGDDDSRGGPDGSPSPRRMAARDISGSCGLPSKQQVEESQHLHVLYEALEKAGLEAMSQALTPADRRLVVKQLALAGNNIFTNAVREHHVTVLRQGNEFQAKCSEVGRQALLFFGASDKDYVLLSKDRDELFLKVKQLEKELTEAKKQLITEQASRAELLRQIEKSKAGSKSAFGNIGSLLRCRNA